MFWYSFGDMSELIQKREITQTTPETWMQSLGQIANYCIDNNAEIGQDCDITLQTSPDGTRSTKIGAAQIGDQTNIDAMAHISDGATIAGGEGSLIGFRANVGNAQIGRGVEVRCGASVLNDAILEDGVIVDNFAYIEGNTVVGVKTHVKPNSVIRSGIHIGIGTVISGSVSTLKITN